MDKTGKTRQGNSANDPLMEAFRKLERRTKLKFPETGVRALENALKRFEVNRLRWDHRNSNTLDLVLWKHTLFTLWAPGGRASRVRQALDLLQTNGWFDEAPMDWPTDELAIAIGPYVRFPRQKASRTRAAIVDLTRYQVSDQAFLSMPVRALHAQIVTDVVGYGNKAAAHLMRNTGLSCGWNAIPIIDVHILKYLGDRYSATRYMEASKAFIDKARACCIPPLLLDAALWCAYADNWDIAHSDFDNFE